MIPVQELSCTVTNKPCARPVRLKLRNCPANCTGLCQAVELLGSTWPAPSGLPIRKPAGTAPACVSAAPRNRKSSTASPCWPTSVIAKRAFPSAAETANAERSPSGKNRRGDKPGVVSLHCISIGGSSSASGHWTTVREISRTWKEPEREICQKVESDRPF